MKKIILSIMFLAVVIAACRKEEAPVVVPEFDRGPMLENWIDNIIIPAHQAYNATTVTLHADAETFFDAPTLANLAALRTSWFESYKAWQNVPFFIDGKGEDRFVSLSFFTNTYPTKSSTIEFFAENGGYNLEFSSNKDIQGYPALDYMLYGLADTDADILAYYTIAANADNYKQYLTDLTARIKALSTVVAEDWSSNVTRRKFVAEDGNSSLSSVNKVVNDFIDSYEFDLQTSKIGFPSGACIGCDGEDLKGFIEAPYRGDISKVLLLEALNAAQDFYNGVPFKGAFEDRGISLYDYLNHLDIRKDCAYHKHLDGYKDCEKLSDVINRQFDKSRAAINKLSDDFALDVETRNDLMKDVHTQLELNALYLKSYMRNAMKIHPDIVYG